jgi:hypothetical protein
VRKNFITVRLSDEEHEILKSISTIEGLGQGEIFRQLLHQEADRRGVPPGLAGWLEFVSEPEATHV